MASPMSATWSSLFMPVAMYDHRGLLMVVVSPVLTSYMNAELPQPETTWSLSLKLSPRDPQGRVRLVKMPFVSIKLPAIPLGPS